MIEFIFNLKNIVILILVAEFMKNLLTTDKYKKYINLAIGMVVILSIISFVYNVDISIEDTYNFNYNNTISQENLVKKEYINKIKEKINEKITAKNIEVEVDENYVVTFLKVTTNDNRATTILKELGFNEFTIINE